MLLHFELSLCPIFIAWRLICQSLYVLISKYLNVRSFSWWLHHLLWLCNCCYFIALLWCICIGNLHIFRSCNKSWVCVASDYTFIPHQVVIDEFSKLKEALTFNLTIAILAIFIYISFLVWQLWGPLKTLLTLPLFPGSNYNYKLYF